MIRTYLFTFVLALASLTTIHAQQETNNDIIEVSGIIFSDDSEGRQPIPYSAVAVKNTGRGNYANYNGIFSIVVKKGETLIFSSLGYKDFELIVADTIEGLRTNVLIQMERVSYDLPETVVFPWPSRDFYRLEFLAMEPTLALQLQEIAEDNLSADKMERMAAAMEADGNDGAQYYLRQQASSYYSFGQARPTPIFDPIAWAKFFKALKDGDFKKKNK